MIPPNYLVAVNPFFAIALCVLIAAGCNAFEFMYDENSSDPDIMLEDARIALQSGNEEKAVELLERALEKAPESQEIRIELASALFQANEIDLLTMKDLAEFISDSESAPASKAAKSYNATCSFTEALETTRILQFEAEEAYLQLLGNTETLERTLDLLATSLNIDAPSDLADTIIGNAYLMRAIASMGQSVLDIKAKADSLGATLHQRSNNSIGYCGPTPEALAEIESFVLCEQLPVFNTAVEDLLFRQNLLGLTESELVDAVGRARDELNNTTSLSCSAFYPAEK